MTLKERINSLLRRNINPAPLTDESIERAGVAYCDPLILYMHDNFLHRISRRMVMISDPIASALTIGWAKLATAKTFKFYESHEPNAQEIMQEYRQWWQMMNLNEVLKAAIPHLSMDGWVLLDLYIEQEGTLGYEVYGSYECHPSRWERNYDNDILQYRVDYVPIVQPFGWASGTVNIKSVRKTYQGGELLHITRGDWNYGLGRSRVLPVWDSITKLRYGSHADFFRRDVRFIGAIPENWTEQKAKTFMDSLSDFMRSTRRAFIYRMDQSKTPDRTPLDLPRFGYTSMAEKAPKPMSQSEAGGALLRDPEWARILAGTQHTENFFIGNQAGAVTGSEVDLTRDFYTECEEFALLEPLIKTIINWFVTLGMIPEPPQDYVIKYWKDWEHIEMASQLAAQEQERWEQEQGKRVAGETKRKELRQQKTQIRENPLTHEKKNRWNEWVEDKLLFAIMNASVMPMTPVMSSWIKKIGYDEGSLYMELHEPTKRGITTYEYNPPNQEQLYQEWIDSGSKGGYWWDYIRDVYSPAFKHGKPPAYLETGYGEGLTWTEGETTQEYKMKGEEEKGIVGAGETRAPLGIRFPSETEKKKEQPEEKKLPTSDYSGFYSLRKTQLPKEPSMGFYETKHIRVPANPTIRNQEKRIFNSAASIRNIAKDKMDWTMSKTTTYKIMDLFENAKKESRKNVIRTNSFAYGNGIKADYPLYYRQDDGLISEEYICMDSWKENIGRTVPLGVYHNRDENSPELPDWQIVGTYTVNGWDEKEGKDIVTLDYDLKKIKKVFEKLNEEDWITPLLIANKFPDVSTAYTCDVIYDKNTKRNIQTKIDLKSVSFVPTGNCPSPVCSFIPEEMRA